MVWLDICESLWGRLATQLHYNYINIEKCAYLFLCDDLQGESEGGAQESKADEKHENAFACAMWLNKRQLCVPCMF